MSDPLARLRRFLRELKRRKVYRVVVGYLVAAFVVLQLAGLAADAFGFPGWFEPMIWVLAGLGLPIAVVLAWAFEVTPEGVQRTPKEDTEAGPSEPASSGLGGWIAALLILLLAGGGAWYLAAGDDAETTTKSAAPTDTSAARTASTARDTAGPPRIAVLPFENIAPDSAEDYFAQGMHEEVLNQLSKVSGLEVISRTSVMGYADTDKRVPEISRELGGVDALMEGTVRRAGDQVRITTQLIGAPEDEHLWSNTYDRALSPETIFDIQADIAEKIAGALETELTGGERRRIEDAPTDDLAAYDAYLQGRSRYFEHWSTWRPADLRRSVEAFREAIRRDSAFAEAHAWLGSAYARGAGFVGAEGWVDSASVAVERARAIEPDLAAVHLAQAQIYQHQDSTTARIASLRRALELQPSHTLAKAELSDALVDDGQVVEAVRVAREAVQLAPRQPVVLQEMGDQLGAVGFYDAAAAWNSRVLEIEPGHFEGVAGLAAAHNARGDPEQGLATWQRYLEATEEPFPLALRAAAETALGAGQPDHAKAYLERIPEARQQRRPDRTQAPLEQGLDNPFSRAVLGLVELRLGNRTRGREILQLAADSLRADLAERATAEARSPIFYRDQIRLAGVLAALGQSEQALERLKASKAGIRRGIGPSLTSPFFEDLRSDRRFQEIVREVEVEQEKLREEVGQLGIALYPPGAEPDTAIQDSQSDE